VVPVTAELRRNLDQICVTELPATIKLLPGKVIIHCQNMEHLLQQLVQLAKTPGQPLRNFAAARSTGTAPPPSRLGDGCRSWELARRGRRVKQIDLVL